MACFHMTVLQLPANDQSGLTPALVYEGLGDVLRAGSSTGTSLLAWIIQYLALHQNTQEQLFEEVNGFVKHHGSHGNAVVVMMKEFHPKCLSFI